MSDYIIGSDEVGYGAWAGPLFVCAVAAPRTWRGPRGLKDSKLLTPAERAELYPALYLMPFSLMSVDNTTIDRVGIYKALREAHEAAIRTLLKEFPDADMVVDGNFQLPGLPRARCVPRADALFPAVSAASIIAKVNRDLLMKQYDKFYPGYGFVTNVGYGTTRHRLGLKKLGVCPLHRRSYRPIKKILEKE